MITLLSILQRLVQNLAELGIGGFAVFTVLSVLVLSGAGGRLLALVEERTNGSR
jgi:hypothetical protein